MRDPDPDDSLRLRTIKEAMRFLSVGRTTVYRLAKLGELEVIKVGTRHTRVTQASLDQYVRNAKRLSKIGG